MQIYGPSRVDGPQGVNAPHTRRPQSPAEGGAKGADHVDISPAAQEAARLAEAAEARAAERGLKADAPIRTELIARLREEIASGAYETPDKLDAALDRLLDELG